MNLNFTAPINQLSYGLTGYNITVELMKQNIGVALFPLQNRIDCEQSDDIQYIKKAYANQEKFDHKAPSLRLFHQFDLAHHIGSGPRIGFPIFELDKFKKLERRHIESNDHIFVCSQWAADVVLAETSISNISVIPLGVDESWLNTDLVYDTKKDKYVFFNLGKWERRKGHDVLATAFNHAFSNDDNVELWLMPHNPFLNQQQINEWESLYNTSKLKNKIKILPWVKTRQELKQIMEQVDCGIFPSRAEGWNLGALELMALGKHIIITNYSGHTEYCSSENSLLIDMPETEPANDGIWFHGDGNWGKFGIDQFAQLINYMRQMYQSKLRLNGGGVVTAKKLTWKNTAEKIIKNIYEPS